MEQTSDRGGVPWHFTLGGLYRSAFKAKRMSENTVTRKKMYHAFYVWCRVEIIEREPYEQVVNWWAD